MLRISYALRPDRFHPLGKHIQYVM